ncbi:MAG: hypothetical protein QG620_721 [Patescibacteria group bacterium]|nr:hypothetical protein [Patescibacteria group bacterium]
MSNKNKKKILKFPKNKSSLFQRICFKERRWVAKNTALLAMAILFASYLIYSARNVSFDFWKNGADYSLLEDAREDVWDDILEPVPDLSGWQTYQNKWYGFELKYPEGWERPVNQKALAGSKWEYRYQFHPKENQENNPYGGFEVKVYNVMKVEELASTDEFPALKSSEAESGPLCATIGGSLKGKENYSVEEVHVPLSDHCYNSDFFYTIVKDEYIYNIIPIMKDGFESKGDPKKAVRRDFSDFFSVAFSFELIDIERAEPRAPKARITAPRPASYKMSNGRMVCEKKNDHPGKSKKGKGRHLDMECCLDPDEYPNPHCYYPPEKYGKYL